MLDRSALAARIAQQDQAAQFFWDRIRQGFHEDPDYLLEGMCEVLEHAAVKQSQETCHHCKMGLTLTAIGYISVLEHLMQMLDDQEGV